MKNEITFIVEPDAGKVTVEVSGFPRQRITELEMDCGKAKRVNCGKPSPLNSASESRKTDKEVEGNLSIWLYRLYHNSVVDGPGRRTVVQVAGCSIRCQGCYVPETHDRQNGSLVSISAIVDELLSKRMDHDGVTILGGEPFDQPGPIAELVFRLRQCGFHITIYSGYTFEDLIKRKMPSVDYIISNIDLLLDGPFLMEHVQNAGEYRGSSNQRFISSATMG